MEIKNRDIILEQAKEYTSFYIYDENVINEYTERLKKNFRGIGF